MNLHEALKKIERLERQVRVNLNLIDMQDRILDELVARVEIQCKQDITHIEIKEEGILKNRKRITLSSKNYCVDRTFSGNDTLNKVIQFINNLKKGFKLIIDRRYGKLPVKMLPNNKSSNLQTNNCLIIIKI